VKHVYISKSTKINPFTFKQNKSAHPIKLLAATKRALYPCGYVIYMIGRYNCKNIVRVYKLGKRTNLV
jgi:hypothetical protein